MYEESINQSCFAWNFLPVLYLDNDDCLCLENHAFELLRHLIETDYHSLLSLNRLLVFFTIFKIFLCFSFDAELDGVLDRLLGYSHVGQPCLWFCPPLKSSMIC